MGPALFVEGTKGIFNVRIDPCFLTITCGFGANGNNFGKGGISGDVKAV